MPEKKCTLYIGRQKWPTRSRRKLIIHHSYLFSYFRWTLAFFTLTRSLVAILSDLWNKTIGRNVQYRPNFGSASQPVWYRNEGGKATRDSHGPSSDRKRENDSPQGPSYVKGRAIALLMRDTGMQSEVGWLLWKNFSSRFFPGMAVCLMYRS